ncbi:polyketide synthase [Mycobacterium sp. 852002-50816_SCH5313054-b]|uniref:mycobactin polyketide synthase MbtD n=1 Tax=Mycobacterium sp. 852002-50816_SCH5313054-b TaxID=1834092 RepID=UPI0008018718|nr:mycobactin polyketide synthase MbtD [Mycobacterium sp. 852002-50816_SCH5313054-b]OBF62732.1 polyketide synthase [Mycobacterium sp. 852002-50816_SCH5313054-b]
MAARRLPDGRIPVLLSAHADELVPTDARAIADYLDRFPETTVAQVARRLRSTRRVRTFRAVIRAAHRAEFVEGLRALADEREHPLVARSALTAAPRQAFVFPGQGGHWPGMGAAAYRALDHYRAAADGCVAAFEAAGVASPLRYLTAGDDPQTFSEIEVQGAQFVHAVALAEVWRSCGVVPDLTIGQSLGEVAAAVVAGSITLPDAVAVVAARAGVVDRLPGRYAMATLGVGAREAGALIAAAEGWVELSVVYSASTVAVSGDRDAVLAVVDAVRRSGGFAREIAAGFPGHTSVLERLRDEFRLRLPASEFAEAPVQFIGGATGDVVGPDARFGEYWYANLRNTVRLDRAFEAAIRCGAGSFIELSAHPALLFSIGQIFEAREDPAVLVGSAHRDEPLADTLSANIVTAAVADPGYGWGDYLDGGEVGLRGFPGAPMRAIPMWAHPEPLETLAGPPGLTVAVEHWEPASARPAPAAGRPARLALVGADQGPLARSLRAAIESHPGATLAAPPAAEVVVAIAPTLDGADAAAAAETLTALIGSGQLDYARALGPHCHTVCLVTVGAERVGDRDTPPSPGQAALAALHRSIGFDYPERSFTHLDLAPGELTPVAGHTAVAGLLSGCGETALRDSESGYALFERSFRDGPVPAQWPLVPGVLDDVVITGGSGALGLHYARDLAERGARRIILLSRRPADPELLTTLVAGYGTELASPPCDITDPAQLSLVAAEYGGAGASLIVHAAGSAAFGTVHELGADAAADTFAAKVRGLAHLVEVWPVRADARMLLCSSVSGVWGGRGHAAYSAANRLLDVIAGQLRDAGRHCVAVRWGLWQGSTESGRSIADSAGLADIERSGLRPMAPREAIEASLREWREDPLVFAADASRLRMFLDGTRSGPPGPTDAVAGEHDEVSVPDAVRSQLAAVLGIERPAELNLAESLFDLGVDSMLALDLRKRLTRMIGRTVSLATLMGEITGDELVEQLGDTAERLETTEKVDISRD